MEGIPLTWLACQRIRNSSNFACPFHSLTNHHFWATGKGNNGFHAFILSFPPSPPPPPPLLTQLNSNSKVHSEFEGEMWEFDFHFNLIPLHPSTQLNEIQLNLIDLIGNRYKHQWWDNGHTSFSLQALITYFPVKVIKAWNHKPYFFLVGRRVLAL